MVDKFERKLILWKRNYLSLGGRITRIKATLFNLPIFYMFLFGMPMAIWERLDHIRRNFLWDGYNSGKKRYLLRWCDVINKPTLAGGLGLPNLE